MKQVSINPKKLANFLKKKKIKIDQVLSSQWCRCKDTAKYAFGKFKEFSALNSTFSPPFDKNEKRQIKELKSFVKNWDGQGKNLVLVTHYVVILAMTGEAPSSGEMIITDKNFNVLSTINTFQKKIKYPITNKIKYSNKVLILINLFLSLIFEFIKSFILAKANCTAMTLRIIPKIAW